MGTFGTPSSYNNTGALGGATNPTTAQGLSRDRENQKALLELPGTQAREALNILDGAITPTRAEVVVDTEGGASADSLTTIALTSDGATTLHEGMIIRIRAADESRVVTLVHGTGVNEVHMRDGNNVVLSTDWDVAVKLVSGKWYEVEGRAMRVAEAAMAAATNAATAADHAQTKNGTSSTASGTAAKVVTCAGFVLSTNARIFVTFSNANTVADALTLNVNGTGAIAVYNQTGAISTTNAALFTAGQPIEFRYDSTLNGWVFYDVTKTVTDSDSAVGGGFSALSGSATGASASVSYQIGGICVRNSSGAKKELRGLSLSASTASTGANGLDTGTIAASTWYYVHVIHNPTTSTTSLLLSLSATSPTLPSGYTYSARVGSIRTDATNKYPLGFTQKGRLSKWLVHDSIYYPIMAYGAMGVMTASSTTLVAISVASFAPPTALRVQGFLYTNNGGTYMLAAPSAAFTGGYGSATMQPPVNNYLPGTVAYTVPFDFMLESTNIYITMSGTTGYAYSTGWEDNL